MRTLFITTVAALSMTGWAQDAPTKITLEQRATTLGMLVDTLAEQTKKPLAISPELRGDVFLLWVHDVPVQDVLDRIAKCAYGKWVDDKDGRLRLYPDNALMHDIAVAKLKKETARVRKLIDDFVKAKSEDSAVEVMSDAAADDAEATPAPPEPAEAPANTKSQEILERPLPPDPDNTLMRVLLSQVSADKLAGMYPGTRIVYAYPATSVQYPFGNIGGAVAAWTQQNNNLCKALEEQKAKNPVQPDQTEKPEFVQIMESMFNDRFERKPSAQLPAKVTLGIVRGGSGFMRFLSSGGYTLEMKVFDHKGDILTKMSTQLGSFNWSEEYEIDPATRRPKKKEKQYNRPAWVKDEAIPVSDDSKEYAKLTNMSDPVTLMTYKPSEDFSKKFADPVNYDPLSFTASDELFAFAKTHQLQLIASLSDDTSNSSTIYMDSGKVETKTGGVYDRFAQYEDTGIEKTDSWFVVFPKDPAAARAVRVDRFALKKLITASKDKEIPSLDDAADYAAANEPPSTTPIVNPYIFFYAPNLMDMMPTKIGDWNVLRVYGLLSQSQRDALKNGQRISFGALVSAQMAATRRLLFGPDVRLMTQADFDNQRKLEEANPMFTFMSMWVPSVGRDYKTDPTEVMPSGVPPQGWISGTVVDEMMVVMSSSESKNDQFKMLGAVGANELAAIQSFLKMAEDEMPAIPKIDRFKSGRRIVLNLKFNVATDVFMSDKLVENRMSKDAKALRYDELPGEFRQIVDAASKKMEKDMEAMKNMRGRSGNEKP